MGADPVSSIAASSSAAKGSKRPRKKQKSEATSTAVNAQAKKRAKGKGRAGKLEGLMLLPMDVLFEIFGHLRPLDILHLARTTKQFRNVLMHKSAISVWKTARANVNDLPECFPGMNEAQFANLAFDQHCHVCLAPNIRSVDWVLRVRLCPKCTKTSYIEVFSLFPLGEMTGTEECEYLVPTRETTRSREVAFIHELGAIKEHWRTLKDDEARQAYARERRAFKTAVFQHATTCLAWFRSQQFDRSQELELARRDRKQAVVEKLESLGWGSEIKQMPAEDDLAGHRLVKQPTRLTERIWKNMQPEMVKYMEQMKANRLDRERKALVISRKIPAIDVLCTYKRSLFPWTDNIMPEPVDFCSFEPVKAILELPNEVEVDESSFAEVVTLLPSLFADWRSDIRKRMLKEFGRMLHSNTQGHRKPWPKFSIVNVGSSSRAATESAEESQSDVDPQLAEQIILATTVFKCNDCSTPYWALQHYIDSDDEEDDEDFGESAHIWDGHGDRVSDATEPLFYPEVMSHSCLTRKVNFIYDNSDPSLNLEQPHRIRTRWSCKRLKIDKKAKTMMEKIVECCGLEPEFATPENMDYQDALLACPLCAEWCDFPSEDAQVPVFGWRAALKHHSLQHYHRSVEWIKLTEDQTTLARATWEAARNPAEGISPPIENWSCIHCLDRPCEQKPATLDIVKLHLLSKHNVSEPQLNVDYHSADADTSKRGLLKSSMNTAVKRPERKHWHYYEIDDDDSDVVYGDDEDQFWWI